MSAARILVIDDEPPIRRLLRTGLGTQDYAVVEAADAAAGLAALTEGGIDLVILDLGLPDMAGHALLGAIRERYPDLPVMVLSSRDDERGKVEALDLGADDYVTKPFGMNELLARIRAALRHRLAMQGERPVFRIEDLSVDLVRRLVRVGCREVKPLAARVRFPAGSGAACGQGAHPRPVDAPRTLLVRPAIPAGLHAPASPEAGARSGAATLHPDGDRRRIPDAGARPGLIVFVYGSKPSAIRRALRKRSTRPTENTDAS